MTTDIVFYPHAVRAVQIDDGTTELFALTLLDDVQPSNNFQDLTSFCAAQVGPQQTGSHSASPDNRFTTPQLTTLLSALIGGNFYVSRDLSAYNVDTYYQAGVNLGMRVAAGTGSHLRCRMAANAMMALESISAEAGQLAQARVRLGAVISANGGDPMTVIANAALAGTASGGRLHTLGPVAINGTTLKGVVGVNLDNNNEYDEVISEGEAFPSYLGFKTYRPVLTIRTRKASYFSTYGNKGVALSSWSWFLRSKLASGINEADASAYHILFSGSAGTIKPRNVTGDKSLVDLQVDLSLPSANTAAYVIAVNQAIS